MFKDVVYSERRKQGTEQPHVSIGERYQENVKEDFGRLSWG